MPRRRQRCSEGGSPGKTFPSTGAARRRSCRGLSKRCDADGRQAGRSATRVRFAPQVRGRSHRHVAMIVHIMFCTHVPSSVCNTIPCIHACLRKTSRDRRNSTPDETTWPTLLAKTTFSYENIMENRLCRRLKDVSDCSDRNGSFLLWKFSSWCIKHCVYKTFFRVLQRLSLTYFCPSRLDIVTFMRLRGRVRR